MPQDHLGLFDTPPSPRQVRAGLTILGLLLVAALVIMPVRNLRWGEVDGIIPMVDAFMFLVDLVTATLLYAQAAVFRSRALTGLASGFVFSALIVVPHALTFPGAFAPNGLLGAGVNTTAWLANFRRMAIPIAIVFYVLLRRGDAAAISEAERPPARIVEGVSAAIVLTVLATLLATIGQGLLPNFFQDRTELSASYAMGVETGVFALFAVSGVFLWRSRNSVLDMWLLVALAAMVIQSLMVLTLHARFTVGWYGLYLQTLASRLVVMLALLAESNRLYARLALASSARNRERDVRLMSMDAVASAISQEVGQTVAAVMLNLRSSRAWLSGATPQVDEAIASLDAAIDAGNATFGAIKGAQALFATGRGLTTDCSVNDLVRASASSLSRELAGRKISLHLDLDKRVSTIVANPVQLQRVFVNLLTNAMEALDTVRGRSRRIGVRTALFEGNQVLIEISDNGGGIEQDEVARIFDDFFTTKASGTGLGLSLSRTIVEEHGGRLWASAGEEHGAVFHVQLPLSALP